MRVIITVSSPTGQSVDKTLDVQNEGDLADAIRELFGRHRSEFPDAPAFEKIVKVDHA